MLVKPTGTMIPIESKVRSRERIILKPIYYERDYESTSKTLDESLGERRAEPRLDTAGLTMY